jgi:hypothetical protein
MSAREAAALAAKRRMLNVKEKLEVGAANAWWDGYKAAIHNASPHPGEFAEGVEKAYRERQAQLDQTLDAIAAEMTAEPKIDVGLE